METCAMGTTTIEDMIDARVDHRLKEVLRDVKVVTAMISSMVESAAGVAMWSGDIESAQVELKKSVRRILAAEN